MRKGLVMLRRELAGLFMLFAFWMCDCNAIQTIQLIRGGENGAGAVSVSIPLLRNGYHYALPGVRVQDSGPNYTFLLDTGAHNVISRELAHDLAIPTALTVESMDSNEVVSQVDMARLSSLSFAGIEIRETAAAMMDLRKLDPFLEMPVDGILGANSLRFFAIRFRTYRSQLAINPEDFLTRLRAEYDLQLGLSTSFRPGVEAEVGNRKALLILDTGAYISILDRETFIEWCKSDTLSEVEGRGGVGAFSTSENLLYCELSFNPILTSTHDATSQPGWPVYLRPDSRENLLGLTALDGLELEIDFPKNKVRFFQIQAAPAAKSIDPKAPAKASSRETPALSAETPISPSASQTLDRNFYPGFTLHKENGTVRVLRINRKSRAYANGLRPEMEILDVDGTEVRVLGLTGSIVLLESKAHGSLKVMDGGSSKQIDY
ncbi:MAG: aspartyl protease family protein [Leptospiraceae bacterium]|nr:aspartyl protease family protein [Leptospiraceae bacterium]